jgi:hypothetical protein
MLFFILSMDDANAPHWASIWYDNPPDDLTQIVEKLANHVRKQCMQIGQKYVAMWDFNLKDPMQAICNRLHAQFQEKLRKVLVTYFAVGYTRGRDGKEQSAEDVAAEEAELVTADIASAILINAAFSFGRQCGTKDSSKS